MKASIILTVAAAAALAFAAPAAASTVHEGDLAGGSFSRSHASPTQLAAGVTGVTGTGRASRDDFFVFTGLPTGAQTLTFTFSAVGGVNDSFSAGGNILTSANPFRWEWDGVDGGSFEIRRHQRTDTKTVRLGAGFGGTLFVGLYFTHGPEISYSVSTDAIFPASAPATEEIAQTIPAGTETIGVVPLPGAGLMLLTALGAAGLAARRRRA